MGRTGPFQLYAQENPDLEEQPERAPEGIDDDPPETRKLVAEIVFFTFRLPHSLHLTMSALEADVVRTSKCFLQSLHVYS